MRWRWTSFLYLVLLVWGGALVTILLRPSEGQIPPFKPSRVPDSVVRSFDLVTDDNLSDLGQNFEWKVTGSWLTM